MPLIPFRILMDVTVFNSSPMKNQDGALYDKKQVIAGNCGQLLLQRALS